MRLIDEEHFLDLEPPFDEISEVHAVEDFDEDFPEVELAALTDDEAQALAAEFEELDLPAVELTQEQALALIAELEAEYPSSHDITDEIILEAIQPLNENQCEEDDDDDNDEELERQQRLKEEEQEMIRLSRAELQKRLAEIDEELELLRIRKEKRRKEQAEYLELMVQYEQERKERQEKERIKRQEEIEKKKLEREKRQNSMNSFGFQLQFIEIQRPQPPKCAYKTPEELARQKEEMLNARVPPLVIDAASTEAVREMAEDLHDRLIGAVGTIFDLTEKVKKTSHELNELRSRLGNFKTPHDHNQFPEPGRVITTREEFQKGVS